jgi:hypothetical protein
MNNATWWQVFTALALIRVVEGRNGLSGACDIELNEENFGWWRYKVARE